MRLSGRTLVFAAILVVVIGLGLILLNSGGEGDTGADEQVVDDTVVFFPDLEPSSVTSFRVAVTDEATGEPVESVYSINASGAWTLNGELSSNIALTETSTLVQADVSNAVGTLLGLTATEQFESDDLETFGLDAAQVATLALEAGDETVTARIGNPNPNNTRYYALLGDDDNTVYLVTNKTQIDALLGLGAEPPFEPTTVPSTPTAVPVLTLPGPLFLDQTGAQAVTALRVRDNVAEEEVVLTRESTTAPWQLVQAPDLAEPTAADAQLMPLFLSILFSLNAVDGLPADNLEALGLAEPAFTITATYGDSQTATLQVGGTDPSGTRTYTLFNDFEQVAVLTTDDVGVLTGLVAEPPLPLEAIVEEATEEATAEATEAAD